MEDWEIYILCVKPADGWGKPYVYCFHKLENARAQLKKIAERYDMEIENPDYAWRYDNDINHRFCQLSIKSEMFED